MAQKFIVYLVNGTEQVVYDLKRGLASGDKFYGFSDEKCKKKIEFDPSEVHMWDEADNNPIKNGSEPDEFRSYIKLPLRDNEYLDLNACMDCAGIDIDDTRAIAVFLLRNSGIRVLKE